MTTKAKTTDQTPPPAAKPPKAFDSVADMVRNTIDDDSAFVAEVEAAIRRRHVLDLLMARRAKLGLSQKQLAVSMDCSQSRISKLESGSDLDLSGHDLNSYAEAVGLNVTVLFTDAGTTLADQVKTHVLYVGELLKKLVELAGEDKAIAAGTQNFFGEVLLNSVRCALDASTQLAANVAAAGGGADRLQRYTPPTAVHMPGGGASRPTSADDPVAANCG